MNIICLSGKARHGKDTLVKYNEVNKKEINQMPTKVEGMGTIYIDGNALLKMIDAIVCEELPVDEQWAKGLKYSKRIIKQMMGIDQEEGV